MSRLVDASLCPDCRTPLERTHCPGCGLDLVGALAVTLWQQLSAADATIRRLRAPSPAAVLHPAPVAPRPNAAPATRATGLDGKTVPVLLLALGGLLVFVAVSLFLAVTWGVLPLAVKAAIMLGVTGAIALVARALTRRALLGSAETMWALVATLVVLDLSAAWRSDLAGLNAVPLREMVAAGAVVLTAIGVGVALWARTTPLRRLVSAQVVAGGGLLVLFLAELVGGLGLRPAVGVVLLAAVGVLLRRPLPEVALAAGVLAGFAWLDLAGIGAMAVEHSTSRASAWQTFAGWPLVVAAVLAAVVTVVPRVPALARTTAAAAVLAALAPLALLPVAFDTSTTAIAAVLIIVLSGVAVVPSTIWSRAGAVLAGLAALGLGVAMMLLLLAETADRVAFLWDRTPALGTRLPRLDAPAPWTVPLVAVAVLVAVYALTWHASEAERTPMRRQVIGAAPAVLAFALAGMALGLTPPLWLVVLVFVVTALVDVPAAVATTRSAVAGALGLVAGAQAVALASAVDLALAVTLTVAAVTALVVTVTTLRRTGSWAAVAAAIAPFLTAAAIAWTATAHLAATPALVVVELVGAAALVTAGWWLEGARRLAVEASAGLMLVLVVGSVADQHRFALALTVAGSAIALTSVLHHDRLQIGWVASGVLALATLVRFTDHAATPELYALPAAAVLLGAGGLRMRTDGLNSWQAFGSGLSLALLPSLLLSLEDPASLRTLLVGLGALLALAVGARQRWQAPYMVGAGVLAALALRFLLPLARDVLADPLGAWMLFGAAGAALLAAGIMWEQSLRQLRAASQYVGALG